MAVVSEVVAVCSSILGIVSKIDNVKEDWFTASAEYQSEAEILRSRLISYVEQVRIHQQPVDSTMMKTLKRAESTLKRAEARLTSLEESVDSNQCCSQIWWLYAKVTMTLFPEKLESTLKKVNQDLDGIPKILKDEQELSGLLREAGKSRAISTVVHNNDNKYVPIEKSQSAVIQAIENSDGPPMILLHGGVGKGKSTLARYMCERYGQFGEKQGLFDHVIVVSCANSSIIDLATKQYEILEQLSPASLTEESRSKSGTGKSGESMGSKSRIAEALQKFFIGKKVLMVLDDVSDKGFLYKMWEAARDGKDDKILITSQLSNICDDFKHDSLLITMEDPTKEEARQILASLVGLESNRIPENIQGIADEMIKATAGNPLALACLASNFAYAKHAKDKTKKRDWQAAWTELSQLLGNKAMAIVVGQNSETAARSLSGAMKICIDSLQTEDAKHTLFLMYACKGESVPEEVLRILCSSKMSNSTFKRSIDELSMRELLKPTTDTLASKMNLEKEPNVEESPAWLLQSLVKLFMERHLVGKQEMSAVIGALVGDDEFPPESSSKYKVEDYEQEIVKITTGTGTETTESDEMRVTIALCALYFDRRHTDQGVTRAVAKASKISNLEDSDENINDLRRKAIEPLIWLLDKPEEDDEWTKSDKCCVRKVVLDYICKRQLNNENIIYLLKLAAGPAVQLATLKAIAHITSIEETPLLKENTVQFLQAVVDLLHLKEGLHTGVQEAASTALRRVCWKAAGDKSATLVANMSSVLDVLVHSLAIPVWESEAFAENAAYALKGLAFSEEEDIEQIIVNKQDLLASLVNCLSQNSTPSLQKAAAGALENLACTQDDAVKLRIANEEGAVIALANCLSKDENPHLQIRAAAALRNLASSNDDFCKLRIVNEKGALVDLANCLSKHDNCELQIKAAGLLRNLAWTLDDSLKWRIANENGALVGLANCLSKHDNRELQIKAAGVLRNLAWTLDDSLKLRIANEKGALVGLANCLSKHDSRELQIEAAAALRSLAFSKDDSLKSRITDEKGALVGLVNVLSKNDSRQLQIQAAGALRNLAWTPDDTLKLRIANEKGALVRLANCLRKRDNCELQIEAAGALRNLAFTKDDSLKLRIANENGALVGLVNCLSQCANPDVQREATIVISNLALAPDGKAILQGAEGLLQGLTSLVEDDVRRDIRSSAVQALFRIDLTLAKEVGLLSAQLDGKALSHRIFVKAKFGDFEGALDDANEAITMPDGERFFILQERGVLKRMMEDLEGALADLEEGLKLETNDYEMLKHRGYVKSLLNDVEGARADAEWALSIQSSRDDSDDYLGATPVEYLGYKL